MRRSRGAIRKRFGGGSGANQRVALLTAPARTVTCGKVAGAGRELRPADMLKTQPADSR